LSENPSQYNQEFSDDTSCERMTLLSFAVKSFNVTIL